MTLKVFFCLFLAGIESVSIAQNTSDNLTTAHPNAIQFDFQGHRGCRGLMPENTIPGFIHALDLGVVTLEMDVVITGDEKVICSHDPWFSHEIALDTLGDKISESSEKNFKIFDMSYSETQNFDVGLKPNKRFPDQQKIAITKPLLADVIDQAEQHASAIGRPKPFYNIETKCTPETDNSLHPEPAKFSDLLLQIILEKGIASRTIIQSFDNRTLKYIHKHYPEIKTALLVENTLGIEQNIDNLGFFPTIYSPDFSLVDADLIAFCRARKIQVIPWTVNEVSDMKRLIALGVDGLISDYPDRFKSL